MAEKASNRIRTPPVVWWILAAVVICFLFMWGNAGLSRTLWWLGLLVASIAIAVVTLWIRDSLDPESAFHTVADLTTRAFWSGVALIFLFGVLVTGETILGRTFSSLFGSGGYSEELPENWRR